MKNYTDYIEKKIGENLVPGIICGVFDKDGKTLYEHIGGYSDPSKREPMKKDAIFRLASMTKPITGLACMKAEELGLLSIEDDITKYLPEYKDMSVGKVENGEVVFDHKAHRAIKIRDILTHSSGIGSGEVGNIQTDKNGKFKNLDTQIKNYSTWFLDFDPGETSFYSGATALDIVVKIIEIVSKMSYVEFIHKYILDPLDMVDTTYVLSEKQKPRLVNMYFLENDRKSMREDKKYESGFDYFEKGYVSGCAGLFSTYHDYKNFCMLLVNKGVFNGKRLFKKETIEKYATPLISSSVKGVDGLLVWGAAVLIRLGFCDYAFLPKGSYGWSGAYSTHFFIDPKNEKFGLIMMNLNNNDGSGAVTSAEFEKEYTKIFDKN